MNREFFAGMYAQMCPNDALVAAVKQRVRRVPARRTIGWIPAAACGAALLTAAVGTAAAVWSGSRGAVGSVVSPGKTAVEVPPWSDLPFSEQYQEARVNDQPYRMVDARVRAESCGATVAAVTLTGRDDRLTVRNDRGGFDFGMHTLPAVAYAIDGVDPEIALAVQPDGCSARYLLLRVTERAQTFAEWETRLLQMAFVPTSAAIVRQTESGETEQPLALDALDAQLADLDALAAKFGDLPMVSYSTLAETDHRRSDFAVELRGTLSFLADSTTAASVRVTDTGYLFCDGWMTSGAVAIGEAEAARMLQAVNAGQ